MNDLSLHDYKPNDIMVMASDSLCTNEEALECVQQLWGRHPHDEKIYTNIAHDFKLVYATRGMLGMDGWRTAKEQIASGDDITVFVVPLNCHQSPPKAGCLGEAFDNPSECVDPITNVSGNPENVGSNPGPESK